MVKSRSFLFGVILGFCLWGPSLFALDNYAIKYQANDKLEEIQSRLGKEIAKKRFSLNYTAAYYYATGDKLKEQGELRKAVQNYEYAIFLEPKTSGNYYSALAEIYYFLGQFSESVAYLREGLKYPFYYRFDKMKALYLLITDYFRLKKDVDAVKLLKEITGEYQEEIDRQVINGLNIKYEYYAPAFFLLSLYYRNHGEIENYPILLQKALQLGFKKEYINYFLYEVYQDKNQDGIALEYLKRSKELQPNVEKELKLQPWVQTYDIYSEIEKR